MVVVAVSGTLTPRLTLREPGWGIGLVCVSVVGWCWRMPGVVPWLAQPTLWIMSAVCLMERVGWTPLRRAVIGWAWVQVALWPLSWMGWTLYGTGWTGTLSNRSTLGIWLCVASLWSARGWAWGLAIMSLVTGSLTGLPALMRLLPMRWRHPLNWTILGLLGVAGVRMSHRWTDRWTAWREVVPLLREHWLTGWGFYTLPRGFREAVTGTAGGTRWFPVMDLHNTWLDVGVRSGVVGFCCLLAVMGWAAGRAKATRTSWTWWTACWIMTWQSVGAQPALLCLAIVWLLSLCHPRRLDVRAV